MNTIDTTTILDQISVIRVQLDELEREIRESLPKEEKPRWSPWPRYGP